MCFHSREDERAWEMRHNREGKRAFLRLTDKDGELIGSIPVNFADKQEMSNVLRDLLSWHPEGVPNWSEVNRERRATGLYIIDEADLPRPKGRASKNLVIEHDQPDANNERLMAYLNKISGNVAVHA